METSAGDPQFTCLIYNPLVTANKNTMAFNVSWIICALSIQPDIHAVKNPLQVGDRVVYTNARTQSTEKGVIIALDLRLPDVSHDFISLICIIRAEHVVQGTLIATIQRDAGGTVQLPCASLLAA
jgi:hypothetical protein